jgi:Mce-associated membrane protein
VTPPVSGSGSDESDATKDSAMTESETAAVPTETEDTAEATDLTESSATELTDAGASEAAEADAEAGEDVEADAEPEAEAPPRSGAYALTPKPSADWSKAFAYGILPALALLLALGAGFLKWADSSVRDADAARAESVQVAKDSTIRMLSYKPDTVEQDLTSARDLLTGDFRDSYTQLTNDVVIPGSKQKQISAVASVPAVASVSADPTNAVVLVFVNQTVVVGSDAPTATASSVQVTLVKVGDRWLISKFDPV